MLTINLPSPVDVKKNKTSQEVIGQSSQVKVMAISDNGINTVSASFIYVLPDDKEKIDTLVLWKDADYTAIGDWTQAQAEARIVELL